MKPKELPMEVVDLLLPRLKDEFKAFAFYRSATNWCKGMGYDKAAAYFTIESTDELEHAKGIENFLVDWNVTPDLPVIDKPKLTFTDLQDVLEKAYALEYALYGEYENTSAKIFKTGDLCVFDFLQTYRTIQQKSVAEYSDKLNVLDGVERTKCNFLLLEKKLF